MIPKSYIDYYGDETRWFIGRVVKIDDPWQLGRVKVRIYGIHGESTLDIPVSDLPWAQTIIPVTEGGSSGLGATIGIKEQAQVFGIFLDGKHSQLPLVLGSIPKIETGSGKFKLAVAPNTANKTEQRGGDQKATSVNAVDNTYLVGTTNIEKAYNFFVSPEGGSFNQVQAAAMIGNFLHEAPTNGDIDPNKVSGYIDPRTGLPEGSKGIAQWNPAGGDKSRLKALYDFAGRENLPWNSLYAQVKFVKYELNGPEKRAFSKLKQARSAEDAAELFAIYYERPARDKFNRPLGLSERQENAKEILELFP